MTNTELVERYPFLALRDDWTRQVIDDYNPERDGTYLDDMPIGWKIAFGEQLCEEILEDLIKCDFLDQYMVVQVKEKYGSLCWYDNGIPLKSNIDDIVQKYEYISEHTCVVCGKPATKMSIGWICPYCDDHAPEKSVPITDK